MTQAAEFTEKADSLNKKIISEYTSYQEDKPFVVRYARTLPDEETLRGLIGFSQGSDVTPYLSAVLIKTGGKTEAVFGHARIHYEIVRAVEEEGEEVDDWAQAQLEIEGESVRFEKLGLRGNTGGRSEDNLKLLLGRINPDLFMPQQIPITVWTELDTYSYNPLNRELKEEKRGVAPGKTVISSLGLVEKLY